MIERIAYGADPFQFGELTLPGVNGPHPVAIVLHGGFWRAKYDLEYIRPVCEALATAGVAAWNLEYRRIGNPGGGWPGTVEDIVTGAEHLALMAPRFDLDVNRVIAIGHSAGGHLALCLAARTKILRAAVSLAGVLDLRRAWELRLSNGVVEEFLRGSPDQVPGRYAAASPMDQLPLGIPQTLFHGTADADVPFEISERYALAAQRRGDEVKLAALEKADHYAVVDPATPQFKLLREAVVEMVG